MRLMDKVQRYEKLINNPDISSADESIFDTLGDAITYLLMFCADLFCNGVTAENEQNIEKTREYLKLLACTSEEDIELMANKFKRSWLGINTSLSDAVFSLYTDKRVSIADYILFAVYLATIAIKVVASA